MTKSGIEKMNWDEIIKQVGTVVYPFYLPFILKRYEDVTQVGPEIEELNCNGKADVNDFLKKYKDKVDKEKYVLAVEFTTDEMKKWYEKRANQLNLLEKYSWDITKKVNRNANRLLKNTLVEMMVLESNDDGIFKIEKIYTSVSQKEHEKYYKDKEYNECMAKEIVVNEEISQIFQNSINLDDFEDFLPLNPKNGNMLKCIARNNLEIIMNNTKKELGVEKKAIIDEVRGKSSVALYINLLEEYGDMLDMDKLLLVLAYRTKNRLEIQNLSPEDQKLCIKMMQFAGQNIHNPKAKVYTETYVMDLNKKEKLEYSLLELEKDMKRIIGEKYYSNKALSDTREKILAGEKLSDCIDSKQHLKLLKFSMQERKKLIQQNPENFEYLLNVEILSSSEIREYLENIKDAKINLNSAKALYIGKHIDEKRMIDFYINGNLERDTIIQLNELANLAKNLETSKLMEYYFGAEEDEERAKAFKKYAALFYHLKVKDKTPEEQAEIAEQIMETLYETERDYDEDLKNLYVENLLPIQTVIDWGGQDMIYKMVATNSLIPRDAKKLFLDGQLDIDKVTKTLKYSKLSDAEKLDFIYGSFDGTGETEEEIKLQDEAVDKLLESLGISESTNEPVESKGEGRNRGTKKGVKSNQYKSDPRYTWQLMAAIDKDYTKQVFPDGTVVFIFPNVRNGTVLIEKMFDKTKNGTKLSYGYATYIMSKDVFDENEKSIIKNNRISRRGIMELGDSKYRHLNHSAKWATNTMEALEKNFGICVKSDYSEEDIQKAERAYSKEDIEKIKKIAEKSEKSRRLMSDYEREK